MYIDMAWAGEQLKKKEKRKEEKVLSRHRALGSRTVFAVKTRSTGDGAFLPQVVHRLRLAYLGRFGLFGRMLWPLLAFLCLEGGTAIQEPHLSVELALGALQIFSIVAWRRGAARGDWRLCISTTGFRCLSRRADAPSRARMGLMAGAGRSRRRGAAAALRRGY
jgi:hypothetical protein